MSDGKSNDALRERSRFNADVLALFSALGFAMVFVYSRQPLGDFVLHILLVKAGPSENNDVPLA